LGDISHGISYEHEDSAPIIKKATDILNKIPAGTRLIEVMNKYNIPVKVLKGKELTYNTPDEQSIFMFLPPKAEKNPELVALVLGCAIRDVEQGIVGFTRPDKELDPVEFASMTFTKSLDIVVSMCQIADEMEEKLGYEKPLDIIEELGHIELYRAYKAKADHNTLVDIFVQGEYDEGNE
jgi:hypothetical protein